MEAMSQDRMRGASPAVFLAAAAWVAVYFSARVALQYLRPESFEAVSMAIAPVLAFFGFVWVVQRAVRRADELQRLVLRLPDGDATGEIRNVCAVARFSAFDYNRVSHNINPSIRLASGYCSVCPSGCQRPDSLQL